MDRDPVRSNRTSRSSNYDTASKSRAHGPPDDAYCKSQHEDDERSVRSGKSSVWTDVSVRSSRPPSIAPSQTTVPSQQIPGDARSVRSNRSSSTIRAQHASSTAPSHHSHHSHRSQHSPRAPSFPTSNDSTLVDTDERIWNTQGGSGGQRIEIYYDRGVLTTAGNREAQDQWPDAMRAIFHPCPIGNMDLFEEALESPGSGVMVVGKVSRPTLNGNEPLARVGEHAMRLALKDQCYLLQYSEDLTAKTINRMLSRERLYQAGVNSKLETWIRPMKPIHPAKKNNLFSLLKEDAKGVGHDKTRTIARAVKACMGAIYFDQGYGWVKLVMFRWGLTIKMPEGIYGGWIDNR